MKARDALIKKLKNMKQYKNFSEEQLQKLAIEKLAEEELVSSLVGLADDEERRHAKTLFEKYCEQREFEDFSEMDTLKQLIYLEVLILRIQKFINQEAINKNGMIPLHMTAELRNLGEQVQEYKKQLGLNRQTEENTTVVSTMTQLMARFKKWINQPENRANYELKCPHCQEYVLIRRRIDKEKDVVLEHPWFIDGGLLFNKHLFKMNYEGKISDEDVAKILLVSPDYLSWIKKHYSDEILNNNV